MISLFVDTSLSYIRIALFKDEILIDSINEKCNKDLSRLFDLRVRDIFSRNNIDFKDVQKIYAITGPGSFTGIRVGLTFVKVLAWSLGIDVIPISELQVIASTNCESSYIVPLIDARRGYVYAGVYNSNLYSVVSDKYVYLSEFDVSKYDSITYVSHDSFDFIDSIMPDIDFTKIFLSNKDKSGINAHVLVPNYLKDTEAEENLKKKLENDC